MIGVFGEHQEETVLYLLNKQINERRYVCYTAVVKPTSDDR